MRAWFVFLITIASTSARAEPSLGYYADVEITGGYFRYRDYARPFLIGTRTSVGVSVPIGEFELRAGPLMELYRYTRPNESSTFPFALGVVGELAHPSPVAAWKIGGRLSAGYVLERHEGDILFAIGARARRDIWSLGVDFMVTTGAAQDAGPSAGVMLSAGVGGTPALVLGGIEILGAVILAGLAGRST